MTVLPEKIEFIQEMLKKGEYDKSYKELQILEKKSQIDIESNIEIRRDLIKSYIQLSKYETSFKISRELKNLYHNKKNFIKELEAIAFMIESYNPLGKLDESETFWQEGVQILNTNYVDDSLENKAIKAHFLFISGNIFQRKHEDEKARSFYEKSLTIRQDINDILGIATCYLHLGNICEENSENDEAIEYFSKSISFSSQLGENMCLNWAYAHIGWTYFHMGKLEKVEEYANKSIEMSKNLKNTHCESFSYIILGQYFLAKLNFSKALEYFNKNLTLRKIQGNDLEVAYTLHSIGSTYSMKGDLSLALIYYNKILKIPEAMKDPVAAPIFIMWYGKILGEQGEYESAIENNEKALSLLKDSKDVGSTAICFHHLISFSIISGSIEKANLYLEDFKKLNDKYPQNKRVNQNFKLDQGLVLKNSKRYRDKIFAQKIFLEIINDDVVQMDLTIEATLNLIESLIFELETSGDEEILSEVKKLSEKLLKIAKEENSFSLLSEILVFQAKLALLDINVEEARRLYTKAQQIAESEGLGRLASKISQDHDSLLTQLDKWDRLIEDETPLKERVEHARYEFLFSKMVRNINKESEKNTEMPHFLVIWTESGLDLFSMMFIDDDSSFNKKLIAGFLSAFETFGKEALLSTGSIDRIKHGEYTIVIRVKEQLKFGYAFKGHSYNAIKNLDLFIDVISNTHELWNSLVQSDLSNQYLSENISKSINSIAFKIFNQKSDM